MSAELIGVIVAIAFAMAFNYTNGFHDAANAIATSVSTRALTPRAALALAAVGNLIGSFFGAKVAKTVGDGIITAPAGFDGLMLVVGALIGAIAWNLITWYYGLPSSSSHALIGGLVGAAAVGGGVILWGGILVKVVIPMVVSPLVGLLLGYGVMLAVTWIFRRGHPGKLNRGFRIAQTVSAAGMAFGHGMQDAAKTIGIVVLALYTGGVQDSTTFIPLWVYLLSAFVLALGTYAGGWRIIRTLGRRVIDLDPPHGFAAEASATTVLWVTAQIGAPISTTHTITSAIMGVGATKRLSAVRWGVAGNIVGAWVLTFPGAALIAIVGYYLISVFF